MTLQTTGADQYIRALVSGLPEPKRSKRLLFMLQTFVDASGNKGQSAAFVFAGYISSSSEWSAFALEWDSVLKRQDPVLDYFKMQEAWSFTKQFDRMRGWTIEKRNARVAALYAVIEKHVKASVCAIMPFDVFLKVFGADNVPSPMRDPYFLLAFDMMAHVYQLQEELGLNDKLDWIFDDEMEKEERVTGAWMKFKRWVHKDKLHLVGDFPSFKDDVEVNPLQASDLLAWWIRRRFQNETNGKQKTELLWTKTRDIPSIAGTWSESYLRNAYSILFDETLPNGVLEQMGLSPDLKIPVGPFTLKKTR